jgi:hypothetical protein
MYEESLAEQPKFHVLEQGKAAVSALVEDDALSDIQCLRLGGADADNVRLRLLQFSQNFRLQLQGLATIDQELMDRIVNSLLGDRLVTNRGRARLSSELRGLGTFSRRQIRRKGAGKTGVDRNDLYMRFVTYGSPTDSPYRRDPWTFELKKMIDAVYTGNLPAYTGTRTFTPRGMPTPVDLEINWRTGDDFPVSDDGDFNAAADEIVGRARNQTELRAWSALEHSLAVPLPSPQDLTHADVIHIRTWSSWEQMMVTMENHLDVPLNQFEMKRFWDAYNEFLRELSSWWLAQKREQRAAYAAGVARIWRYGRLVVGLVQLGNRLFPVLPPSAELAGDLLAAVDDRRVVVSVETGLYLYQRAGVEWRRSQAVRGVQKRQMVELSKLRQTFETVRKLRSEYPSDLLIPGLEGVRDIALEEKID